MKTTFIAHHFLVAFLTGWGRYFEAFTLGYSVTERGDTALAFKTALVNYSQPDSGLQGHGYGIPATGVVPPSFSPQ